MDILAGTKKLADTHRLYTGVGFGQFSSFWPHIRMWHINRQDVHKSLNFQFAHKSPSGYIIKAYTRLIVYLFPVWVAFKKHVYFAKHKIMNYILRLPVKIKMSEAHIYKKQTLAERLFKGYPDQKNELKVQRNYSNIAIRICYFFDKRSIL